ncbi:MAG: hypothetical protein CVU96_02880, partial [Firmicutes bacterium HGW-Firmicutes-20]
INYMHFEQKQSVSAADIETLKNIIKILKTMDFTAKEKKSYSMMNVIDSVDNRISDNIRLMTIEFNVILGLAQTIQ